MFDPQQLDDLVRRVVAVLPAGVTEMHRDLQRNVHAVLQNTFSKMDLVSREEFEVQSAVLARTRAMVDELARQVAELETRVKPPT